MEFKEDEYLYRYPANLEEKPMFLFWTAKAMVIIIFAGLISLYFLFSLGTPVPIAVTLVYAFLNMQLIGDERTIADYIKSVFSYAYNPMEWIYTPDNTTDVIVTDKARVNKVRKKKPAHERAQKTVVNTEAKKHQKVAEKERIREEKQKAKIASKERKRKLKEIETLDKPATQKKSILEIFTGNAMSILFLIIILALVAYILLRGRIVTPSTEATNNLQLSYAKSTDISWYSGTVDPLDYIDYKSSTSGITVTANPSEIDSTKLGSVTVTYTIKDKEGHKKKVNREYNVVDNELPIITLKSDEVDINQGDVFDPESNIDSVVDRIDGALKKADESTFGCYTITSDVDTSTPGDYTVQISAIDSNGNETSVSYSVVVK